MSIFHRHSKRIATHLDRRRNSADLESLMKNFLLTGRYRYDLNNGLSPLDLRGPMEDSTYPEQRYLCHLERGQVVVDKIKME